MPPQEDGTPSPSKRMSMTFTEKQKLYSPKKKDNQQAISGWGDVDIKKEVVK